MTDEALFHAALGLPPSDRAAYLAAHCGDPAMRDRVEELLTVHDRPGGPLDDFGTGDYGGPPAAAAAAGDIFGPYKLIQRLGVGGMGEVWVAEQERPVKRRVALKLIRPGMDSALVLARFEQERQALALMDHTNIAKVYDAGEASVEPSARRVLDDKETRRADAPTLARVPYIAMELVKGIPITKYCDELHLSVRDRLALFVPVCQAIQHAHQKGVIHRDVKPSNVLVAVQDGKPVPKVIDFGVAKALNQRLTERSMYTAFGAVVGTLEYMSPEQAELNQLDVDTRSDVYALGVLLYRLLTGTTPLGAKRLRSAAFAEVLRIIKEEDPPKPSTRLSASLETLPTLAAQRRTEPARLAREVRGELDWIVMKCLEKDRTRRYDTASGLARDVERYLADEPVEACPPGTGYRLRKFVRRHRTAATAIVTALLAVAVALTGLTIGFVQARRAEAQARDAEARAQTERERADRNFSRARAAVDGYVQAVIQDQQLARGNFFALRRRLLSAAVPFLDDFVRQKSDDHMVVCEQGLACLQLGLVQAQMGDHDAAARDYTTAREIYRRLVAENPGYSRHRYKLGAVCNNLSNELYRLGRPVEGEEALRESIRVKEHLAADFPDDAEYRRFVAVGYHNLAARLAEAGKPDDAVGMHAQALAIREPLAADKPTAEHDYDLAHSYHGLAQAKLLLGERDAAESLYRKSYDLRRQLATQHPREAEYRHDLAVTAAELGTFLASRGQAAEAEAKLRLGVGLLERLAGELPGVATYRQDLARARADLARFLWDRADSVE